MTKLELIQKIRNIKKGTFVKIYYKSEVPLTAAAKREGNSVIKLTEKLVRLGVDYTHIARVVAEEALRTTPKKERAPWCHWEIPHILAKHNNKDDYYLSVATVTGHSGKSIYLINGELSTSQDVADCGYVLPSYFNAHEAPVVQTININNIIKIGG